MASGSNNQFDKQPLLDQNMNNQSSKPPTICLDTPDSSKPVFFVSPNEPVPPVLPGSPDLARSPPLKSASPKMSPHPMTPPLLHKMSSTPPQHHSPLLSHKTIPTVVQSKTIPQKVGNSERPRNIHAEVWKNADGAVKRGKSSSFSEGSYSQPKDNQSVDIQQLLSSIPKNNQSVDTQPKSCGPDETRDNLNDDKNKNKTCKSDKSVKASVGFSDNTIVINNNGSKRSPELESRAVPGNDPSATSNGKKNSDNEDPNSENRPEDVENDTSSVQFRSHVKARGELRHAMSEVLPNEVPLRKRSQTMANVKEHAYGRLQEELSKAQEELKLKDEECEKLLKVRDQMGEELEDLTASLFEEANNMVQDANIKRMHSEKLLKEAQQQIEVLEAEVIALKQLVLTSTPSSPNKHLHPQISTVSPLVENGKKEKPKATKPFWKTHRRSTSHHEFTKEARQEVEAQQEAKTDRCKEIDTTIYDEFVDWRKEPSFDKTTGFLSRIYVEDIGPCLNFSNVALSERVKECVECNNLTIEPIPGDSSYPRKCRLTENNKLCNYKIKLGEDSEWYSISQLCRNRIASVCDFYTYIRYIHQGLVKSEDKDVFYEIARLRKKMAMARLGYT